MKEEMTKVCGLCRAEIPVVCFSINRKSRDGLHAWCKPCCRKAERERYKIIRKDRIAEVREWQKNNLNKVNDYKKNWRTQQKAGPNQSEE